MMDTLDNLFVRACKSKNPYTRLGSVYRRFYLMDTDEPQEFLKYKLAEVCEVYNVVTLTDFVSEVSRASHYDERYYGGDKVITILIEKIRHAPISKFPKYRKSARFRNY